jgi:hypothetical protein
LVASDASDDRRALLAVYADLREDRTFYVQVGAREKQYKLHPLARVIPQVSEQDFLDLAEDVKTHGVRVPIVLYDDQVLDGRHRVALASALKLPVRVDVFKGTEDEAREHVVSLNVMRRHLTVAQRGLIARELFMPQATIEAGERKEAGRRKGGEAHLLERTDALTNSETAKATEIAAKRSSGLATARTIETMAPVDNAPKTRQRIRSGEITSAKAARKEAIKETGSGEPEKLLPREILRYLGDALSRVKTVNEQLEAGNRGPAEPSAIVSKVNEIREQLDRTEYLTGSVGDGNG